MMSTDLTPLLALRRHLHIAHHVPGRVRLKISLSALQDVSRADAEKVLRLLESAHGIENVRLNAAARSVVITYERARIAPEDWEVLVHGEPEAALATVQGWLGSRPSPEETTA
jgi:hypothetical protein